MEAGASTGIAFVLIIVLLWLLIFVVGILGTAFWIWMIVDCAQRKFKDPNDKVLWILIIVLTHLIGAIIYYFIVKRKK